MSNGPHTDAIKPRVLVVEDDPGAREALVGLLSERYLVESTETAEGAEEKLRSFRPDVLLTDVRLPGASGLTLIPKALAAAPECVVIVMTAGTTVETAIQAMRSGAKDYLLKPINFDALEVVLEREIAHQRIAIEVKHLRERLHDNARDEEIWGESPEMQDVLRTATDVSGSMATVLITGESGTGKEVLARFLHRHSSRADQPFIAVNCAAIPETLLESELFGHEKGAFTGAIARKAGRFERAHGGTIFLDEIAELSPAMQVKLLRVLQERQIERVGGTEPINIDVRVIAATNRNLSQEMKTGKFREDLYYRLNVFQIDMPPLRKRKSDIAGLWSRFVERFSNREGFPTPETTPDAYDTLMAYDWPGNVRELENIAERAVILSRGQPIRVMHLPSTLRAKTSSDSAGGLRIPGSSMEEIEKVAILKTLALVDGSTSKAARMLGISARKIQYRLREWRTQAASMGKSFDKRDPFREDESGQVG